MEDEIYIDETDHEDHNELSQEEISAEDNEDPVSSDQESIEERIDDLLDQIGAGQSYGSMGDYFVPAIGCYAFPGEDCFYHFIGEEERSGWTEASNGCYVPAWSVEVYESYLSSGLPDEDLEEMEEQEGEQLPLPVSQEDISGLVEILQAIYEQDAGYHTASVMYMEQTDQDFKEIHLQLTVISVVLIVLCVLVAILCGKSFADTFFERMRAG